MSRSPAMAGVVVTYFPDPAFEHRLEAIAREVNPLVVVDNSGEPEVQCRLRGACAIHGAEFIANSANRGLAGALNQGFARVADQGVAKCIAFDQDSTPAPGFAAALWATASQDSTRVAVAANWRDEARPEFASRHLRRSRTVPFLFERPEAPCDLTNITCAITSGMLFDLPTWRTLGGFDEGLFLDLVDTDYCLRARAAGYTVAVSADAKLLHRRGAKKPIRLLGRTWWPAFMPPLRLQYLFRNRIQLLRRHGCREPHWVAFEIIYMAKILAEILFLEDRKFAKLAGCMRGTWEGVLGRMGHIREEYTASQRGNSDGAH